MLGHKNTERHFISGRNIEEIGHESNLSANVAFAYSLNLSFPDPVHRLIPADGPPRRVKTEEAESGIDPALCRVGRQRVVLTDTFLSAPLRTMRDRFRVTSLSSDLCR
jgi:hypothetical protein